MGRHSGFSYRDVVRKLPIANSEPRNWLWPRAQKNAGCGVGTAGIARKWEGERRVRLPVGSPEGDQQDTLPDEHDLRFSHAAGK